MTFSIFAFLIRWFWHHKDGDAQMIFLYFSMDFDQICGEAIVKKIQPYIILLVTSFQILPFVPGEIYNPLLFHNEDTTWLKNRRALISKDSMHFKPYRTYI